VEQLLRLSAPNSAVRDMALEINDRFYDAFGVLYLKTVNPNQKDSLYRTLERLKRLEFFQDCRCVFKYGEGLMSILTFPEGALPTPRTLCQDFWTGARLAPSDYYLGVSDIFPRLHSLNLGIRQSLYAYQISRLRKKPSTLFRDIGLFQLVLPFLDSPWLEGYFSHIIGPVLKYDADHDSQLLATAAAYVETDGNIKKTAEALFQHESTVRYRIRKLRELLNMQDESAKFYPQLCLAMEIYLLKTSLPSWETEGGDSRFLYILSKPKIRMENPVKGSFLCAKGRFYRLTKTIGFVKGDIENKLLPVL